VDLCQLAVCVYVTSGKYILIEVRVKGMNLTTENVSLC